jgi:hypothetical protein
MREMMMSRQAMRQAARRLALDAQAVLRKERADRERRLQGLAVAVLSVMLWSGTLSGALGKRCGQ